MRNKSYIALSLAVLAVLASAAQQAEAGDGATPSATALASDSPFGDGRPPSPGPTNPNGPSG